MIKYFVFADLASLAVFYLFCLLPRWRSCKRCLVEKTLFYIYLCAVLYLTLMPVITPIPFFSLRLGSLRANLLPFNDIIMGYGGAVRDIFLNTLMTVPMGFMLPFVFKLRFNKTVLYTALFSAFIELSQMLSPHGMRSCDITDLITNTLGGILGYCLYWLADALAHKAFGWQLTCGCAANGGALRLTKRDYTVTAVLLALLLVRSISWPFV